MGVSDPACPDWVKAACAPDEVPMFDPDCGKWFGVRDGDWEDWRNIRELQEKDEGA
jgi:hypothetical protein